MSTIENKYATFWRLLENNKVYLEPSVSFRGLCRLLNVGPRCFDRFLFSELGFHGEEILASYRTGPHKM